MKGPQLVLVRKRRNVQHKTLGLNSQCGFRKFRTYSSINNFIYSHRIYKLYGSSVLCGFDFITGENFHGITFSSSLVLQFSFKTQLKHGFLWEATSVSSLMEIFLHCKISIVWIYLQPTLTLLVRTSWLIFSSWASHSIQRRREFFVLNYFSSNFDHGGQPADCCNYKCQ